MVNDSHAIGRILYEICVSAQFPLHIWAVAMQYFHAFEEYTSEHESDVEETGEEYDKKDSSTRNSMVDKLILGVTCMLLSVKANENLLNSASVSRIPSLRLASILDWSAKVILAYYSTGQTVSSERLTKVKRRIKEFVPAVELTVMRVIGNSLVAESAFSIPDIGHEHEYSDSETSVLIEIYSSPVCLNHSPCDIAKFLKGTCPENVFNAISTAIERYFIQF